MIKVKKKLLVVASIGTLIVPIVSVISCGKEKATNTGAKTTTPSKQAIVDAGGVVEKIEELAEQVAIAVIANFHIDLGIQAELGTQKSVAIQADGSTKVVIRSVEKELMAVIIKNDGTVIVRKENIEVSSDLICRINELTAVSAPAHEIRALFETVAKESHVSAGHIIQTFIKVETNIKEENDRQALAQQADLKQARLAMEEAAKKQDKYFTEVAKQEAVDREKLQTLKEETRAHEITQALAQQADLKQARLAMEEAAKNQDKYFTEVAKQEAVDREKLQTLKEETRAHEITKALVLEHIGGFILQVNRNFQKLQSFMEDAEKFSDKNSNAFKIFKTLYRTFVIQRSSLIKIYQDEDSEKRFAEILIHQNVISDLIVKIWNEAQKISFINGVPELNPHITEQIEPHTYIIENFWTPVGEHPSITVKYNGDEQITHPAPMLKPAPIAKHPLSTLIPNADHMATINEMQDWLLDLTPDEFNTPGQPVAPQGSSIPHRQRPSMGEKTSLESLYQLTLDNLKKELEMNFSSISKKLKEIVIALKGKIFEDFWRTQLVQVIFKHNIFVVAINDAKQNIDRESIFNKISKMTYEWNKVVKNFDDTHGTNHKLHNLPNYKEFLREIVGAEGMATEEFNLPENGLPILDDSYFEEGTTNVDRRAKSVQALDSLKPFLEKAITDTNLLYQDIEHEVEHLHSVFNNNLKYASNHIDSLIQSIRSKEIYGGFFLKNSDKIISDLGIYQKAKEAVMTLLRDEKHRKITVDIPGSNVPIALNAKDFLFDQSSDRIALFKAVDQLFMAKFTTYVNQVSEFMSKILLQKNNLNT